MVTLGVGWGAKVQYRDYLTKNRKCSAVRLSQLVEQRTGVPMVVGLSPTPGTNTILPNVTLLVSEVILIIYF